MEKALSLQKDRMQSLADVDGNVVYEYTYKEPTRGAVPEQAVKMAKVALEWRQRRLDLTDEQARLELIQGSSGAPLADFASDYPKAFSMVTESERGAEHFVMMARLTRLACSAKSQGVPIEEATAQANVMLQTHCSRGAADVAT
jgi:hypothetical protein